MLKLGLTVPYNDSDKQKWAVNKLLCKTKEKNIQEVAEKYLVWEKQKSLFLETLESHG